MKTVSSLNASPAPSTLPPKAALPTRRLGRLFRQRPSDVTLTLIFVLSVALCSLAWVGGKRAAAFTPPAFQAQALSLTTSGALSLRADLGDLGALSDASFSPAAFAFTMTDAPVSFRLEFDGAEQRAGLYDLSAGTYPLRLTLLEDGRAYHSFVASQGTVDLSDGAGTVSAFMVDDEGRQLFLNARFTQPEAS